MPDAAKGENDRVDSQKIKWGTEQYSKEEFLRIVDVAERYITKPLADFLKQITTISSAAILIILACMDKLFKSPLSGVDQMALNTLVAIATCGFLVAIAQCQRGMLTAVWPIYFVALTQPGAKGADQMNGVVKSASIAFSIGFACLTLSIMLYFVNVIGGFVPPNANGVEGSVGFLDSLRSHIAR